MKNTFIIYLLGLTVSALNAQEILKPNEEKKPMELIGLNARCIDLMPFEFQYLTFNKKLGSGFSVGFGNYQKRNSMDTYDNLIPELAVNPNLNHTGYSLKGKIIPFIRYKKTGMFFIAFNGVAAFSQYKLFFNYTDAIYGPSVFEYKRNFFSMAAESEFTWIYDLSDRVLINWGFMTGIKPIDPLRTIVPGAKEEHLNYMPGAGVGRYVYVNLNIGINYVIN